MKLGRQTKRVNQNNAESVCTICKIMQVHKRSLQHFTKQNKLSNNMELLKKINTT